MFHSGAEHPSRRDLLRGLPVAAASLALGVPPASGQNSPASSGYQLFTADTIQGDIKVLEASPGNNPLVTSRNFTVALTVESAKSAKEFEWHEGRDHILQILSGSTIVEVGGRPRNGYSTGPGEWNAPTSEGSTALTLNKGDMLIIPRNTPHRRSTAGTVTLMLISPQGRAAEG